ncbi:MAG: hypothetical protein D6721_06305 [Gammaproteobacteria bacterium]|nr:MAG: hypothetical protein D6721_06305 [Gammaproteobacteria bacterium]
MKELILEPTSVAQWHALVTEAEQACACRLDEELESYLVFLLMRFLRQPELAGRVMAMEYLEGLNSAGRAQIDRLREVGDLCLLLSGFFPEQAARRLVRISYFVDLGRSSYGVLADRFSHAAAQVYRSLSEGFVTLMDILQQIRGLAGGEVLDPLHNQELWSDTGSRRALRELRRQLGPGATPLPLGSRRRQ